MSFFLLSGILPSAVTTTRLPVTEATLPASSATRTARESRATRSSRPVATKGASVTSKRHGLALHVRAHQRAVGVVVLQERNQAGGHGDQLLGRDVHVIDPRRLDVDEVALAAAGDAFAQEIALVVDGRVGLGDDVVLLAVGGEVLDLVGHAALFDACDRAFR